MNILDKAFPFLVGNRTQFLAFAYAVLRILSIFGVIAPEQVDQVGEVVRPLATATLAAKLSRQ